MSRSLGGITDERAGQQERREDEGAELRRVTWLAAMSARDKERMRRWAREDGVTMAGLLHLMIEREARRRKRKGDGS